MDDEDRLESARGMALAADGVLLALMTKLRARAVLSQDDVDQIFEAVLSGLEQSAPNTPMVHYARLWLDDMAAKMSQRSR